MINIKVFSGIAGLLAFKPSILGIPVFNAKCAFNIPAIWHYIIAMVLWLCERPVNGLTDHSTEGVKKKTENRHSVYYSSLVFEYSWLNSQILDQSNHNRTKVEVIFGLFCHDQFGSMKNQFLLLLLSKF